MRHYSIAAFASVALACAVGFSPAASASTSFDLSKITAATQADLDAAKADADSHGDVFASQCYAGVSWYIAEHGGDIAVPHIVGVASAFQVARDGVKAVESLRGAGAVPPEIVQACGPLALDVQNDIGKAAGLTIFGARLF